jgi:toxin ParE1/3/4
MPKMFLPSYLPGFGRDIQEIVAWSEEHFGALAADRYGLLIRQATGRAGGTDSSRRNRAPRPAPHAYVYHLMFSRERMAGERVNAPRHFVLYRHMDEKVEFARVLHDSRDLARHVPALLQHE